MNRFPLFIFLRFLLSFLFFVENNRWLLTTRAEAKVIVDFGDNSDNKLYLNDRVKLYEASLNTDAHPEIENVVKNKVSFDDIKSTIYISLSSLESVKYYILNKVPRNWFFEALSFSRVTFIYFDENKDHSDIKAIIETFLGSSTNQVLFHACRIPANAKVDESWEQVFITAFYCIDMKHHGPFAVISQTMYADPYDLRAVMDSVVLASSAPILTIENEALVSEGTTWSSFLTKEISSDEIMNCTQRGGNLLKSLKELSKSASLIFPLNKAISQEIIKPIQNPNETFGGYGSYSGSKKFLERHQHLKFRQGISSCSLPSKDNFSFQDMVTGSFKNCSFVGHVTKDYEYHAIRYLQRVTRGKGHEVDWNDPQLEDNDRKCDMAIGITSRLPNVWERSMIRQSWGSLARSLGGVKLFFLYGKPHIEYPDKVLQQLAKEKIYFRDVVVLDSPEGYSMMFKKVTAWFGWAVKNTKCELIVKVDPDTYPRLFPLMKFLYQQKILPRERVNEVKSDLPKGVYFGMINYDSFNWKQPDHPWYFYDHWPHDTLPPFMSGAIYGLSRDLAQHIYNNREPDMRLDDPGIGVILARLKKIDDSLVKYESGDVWYPGHYHFRCPRNRIYDNPFFYKNLEIERNFIDDIFGYPYCAGTSGIPIPLQEMTSVDLDFEKMINNNGNAISNEQETFFMPKLSTSSSGNTKTTIVDRYTTYILALSWISFLLIVVIFCMRKNRWKRRSGIAN